MCVAQRPGVRASQFMVASRGSALLAANARFVAYGLKAIEHA
jgi:hypothetical protein